DFLVNPATGQPVSFDRVLNPADQGVRWFRFTTLGDGRPGDQLSITPAPVLQQTYDLSTLSGTVSLVTGVGYTIEFSNAFPASFDSPLIKITNTSTTASLVDFKMYISSSKEFDTITLVQTNGVQVSIKSPMDVFNGGFRDSNLEMTFTNFLPGRSIQFMTELDSPGLDTFENYQTVFFTLNGAANNVSSN